MNRAASGAWSHRLNFYYFMGVSLLSFHILFYNYQYNLASWNYLIISFFFLFLLSPLICIATKSYTITALNISLTSVLASAVMIYISGGHLSSGLIWCALFPVIGGYLLFKKGAYGGFGLIIIIWLIMYILDYYFPNPDIVEKSGNTGLYRQLAVFLFLMVISFFTITYIRDEERQLEEKKKQKMYNENLLRLIVHDIASPLSVMDFFLKSLVLEKLSEDAKNNVKDLRMIVKNVFDIVTNVREMQALADGKKVLKPEKINVLQAVKDAVNVVRMSSESKNITIEVICSDDNIFIEGDAAILRNQIITNVLSNAIKFSLPESVITVTIISDVKRAVLTICDNGIGIPEHIMSKIFSVTSRTSRSGTSGEMGTGYGMPLAYQYIEMMDGSISITSSEEEDESGTTVTLSFNRSFSEKTR